MSSLVSRCLYSALCSVLCNMLLLLAAIVLLLGLVAVALFGDSPSYRNTAIHKLHVVLLRANASAMAWVLSNRSIYSAIKWSVPGFYCVVVLLCIANFFQHVYPELQHSVLRSLAIAAVIASVVCSTVLVTFADPGTLTAANVNAALARYHDNGLIFFGKVCSTCKLQKPARSKHCSTCNRCVLLYDHHCIWVNNCIGQNNYRWFIAYLVSNIVLMVYGGWLCACHLAVQPRPRGYWTLVVATTQANRIAGILFILAFLFSIITAAFTLLHVRYLYLGVTTNEADKWSEIEHLVSLGVLYHVKETGAFVERASLRADDGTYQEVYLSLGDESVMFSARDEHYTVERVALVERDLDNIYDRGFVENVKERLCLH